MTLNASGQRQFRITVTANQGSAWPDNSLWSEMTGGEKSTPVTKVWDGGQKIPMVIAGAQETADITVKRPFRADRDAPLLTSIRSQIGSLQATVVKQATDANLVPLGQTETYTGILTKVLGPEANANAVNGEAAYVEVTFSCFDVA